MIERAKIASGLAAGAAIVGVDNFAFGGEVSPVVIVAMLLVVTMAFAAIWGRRGAIAAAATWLCIPFAHVVKHLLGLPDTLHPDTYLSILMLAGFTLLVAAVGTGVGVLMHER